MTPSRVINSRTITFLMTEFLQHLATFGADHVCSSVFPFFSLPLAFGMTDGERRCSCNVHVYLFYEPSKKTAISKLRSLSILPFWSASEPRSNGRSTAKSC